MGSRPADTQVESFFTIIYVEVPTYYFLIQVIPSEISESPSEISESPSEISESPSEISESPPKTAKEVPVILSGASDIYEVTAYTAGPESTGKDKDHPEYGITASGKRVQEWRTVSCPPSMPFGTEIFIPYFKDRSNQGIFICEDRGSAITEGKIDVYMSDLSKALKFGRRNIEAVVKTN